MILYGGTLYHEIMSETDDKYRSKTTKMTKT